MSSDIRCEPTSTHKSSTFRVPCEGNITPKLIIRYKKVEEYFKKINKEKIKTLDGKYTLEF